MRKEDFVDLDFLLIRKMKQGDEDAFDLFIHKYYKDILSYCNYHCIDKEYAEDLAQETFIRFFTKLSLYHHKGKIKNYLYTIANHLCIDYMKKVKEIPIEEEKLAETIETEVQKRDILLNRIDIESALQKLPVELREVVVLYYFEELKIKEIAETLRVTVPLAKYRLRQAKLQLKKFLSVR